MALKVKKFWNDALKISLNELNLMDSAEMLLSYPDWKIPSTVYIDAYDKWLGAFIS